MRLIDANDIEYFTEKVGCGKFDYTRRYLIDALPTVDAVPVVHGRWTRENSYGTWKCSECGCKVNRANPLKGNIWNYYYCPNCGADMRGEQDG